MNLLRSVLVLMLLLSPPALANHKTADVMVQDWYGLILELVRHTATYSPPVASRSFAYVGVTAYEAVASGDPRLQSLAGQLNDLSAVPQREAGQTYDEAAVMHGALAFSAQYYFSNTGPTGKRALKAMEKKQLAELSQDLAADVVTRSLEHGEAVAAHVISWSEGDGGAVIANMGFPLEHKLGDTPSSWVPTSPVRQQQFPLLPQWGKNRSFAMPQGSSCPIPPPPAYSEDKDSAFYAEAFEVYETKNNLTPEQRLIARFWSDDPMLSPTPPGHWIVITLDILKRDKADAAKSVDALARLGIALADAFIGCWDAKFQHDLLRPVTYIRRVIDKGWETLLITPPFPEYPSGHSTQSGAAATVLTAVFGANFAFTDATHARDGLKPRDFPNFWAAAEEAGISRLYGGIHFRAAIDRGLDQGRCVGGFATELKTWKN